MPKADLSGIILNYRLDGPEQGPVIMFSNSLGSDLTMWDSQISAFVDAGYRLLRFDTRGHGKSSVPPGPYSIEAISEDAVGLMDILGLKQVHFCGLSMGGMIGQYLGAKHPERFISLALCSTTAHMPPRELWDERIQTARSKGMTALAGGTIDRWFTKSGQKNLPTLVEKIRNMILNTPVEGFCACCAAIQNMDLRDKVRTISVPTLIVAGEHDPSIPASGPGSIHELLPAAKRKVIPDAAHLVNAEQAEVFNRTLLEFLK